MHGNRLGIWFILGVTCWNIAVLGQDKASQVPVTVKTPHASWFEVTNDSFISDMGL